MTQQPVAMQQPMNNKKKKDRENRNSISTELAYDWSQKEQFVTVSLIVGSNTTSQSMQIESLSDRLTATLPDGRSFSTTLHENIVPECTSVTVRSSKCFIKMVKSDPKITWSQLEPVKKLETVIRSKSLTPPLAPPTTPEKVIEGGGSFVEDHIFKAKNVKFDFVDRDPEGIVLVYFYVKNINKETVVMKLTEDDILVHFSTSNVKFLQDHPGSNEDSVFEWRVFLKERIIVDECKHKVTATWLELRLKKEKRCKWDSLSPIASKLANANDVVRDTWMPTSSKTNISPSSIIPPAPPTPPVNENKKPTCLVSPVSKGTRSSPSSSNSYPSSSSYESNVSVLPGTTGLDNIGNTCFMNSVLQCLVNTRELRDYFTEMSFQNEINHDNPLGMGGKLAITFATLMRMMWSGTIRSTAPSKLKSIMSIKANQFSGFAQHDAQEFMVELLDGLHEDLNRIRKKPYMAEPPDLDGWDDSLAATESWRLHKMRNDSIIDDLFKGQFKSTLTCHECRKVSVKFDEFGCLSVPIPKDLKIITVVFFWKDPYKRPKKFFIRVCADAPLEDLKKELSNCSAVTPSCIKVVEVYRGKIHKVFQSGSNMSSVQGADIIMAFELYNHLQIGEPVIQLTVVQRMTIPSPPTRCSFCSRSVGTNNKLKRCTQCYKIGYCDASCQKNHWASHKSQCRPSPEVVGYPFVLSLPQSHATYSHIARLVEAYARYSVDMFQPPVTHSSEVVHRGSISSGEEGDQPELMDVDGAGENSNDASNDNSNDMLEGEVDSNSKADFYWQTADNDFTVTEAQGISVPEPLTVNQEEEMPQLSSSPTVRAVQPRGSIQLPSSTQLFSIRPASIKSNSIVSAPEKLEDNGDDTLDLSGIDLITLDWETNERQPIHCFVQNKELDCDAEASPPFVRHQQTSLDACVTLFTQPENLSEGDSWKCPRCKKPVEATKQMSIWKLPTVLIVQLKRFSFKYVLYSDKIDKFVQYPVRGLDLKPYMSPGSEDAPAIYDLYGVINHMGRLLGGHYTAYARLVDENDSRSSEIDWRHCDDSRVNLCSENRVVNDQAYLLLYRRRDHPFTVPRPLTSTGNGSEDTEEDGDEGEASPTPMSVSSNSQPSTSSFEEEHSSTTGLIEELD